MRLLLLAAIPALLAAAPPNEKRAPIDDPVPKQSFMVDCASSYQRPCLCRSAANLPSMTCNWGEACVTQGSYGVCQRGTPQPSKK